MGFPSPATDYVEQRLSVNSICNVGPNTLLFERSGGYVVLDISLKPRQGSQVLIQHGGGTELATLRGKSLITEDGEAIGLAPIFPYTFYHLTHYWFAAADIPVANDTPAHYADAIRCNVRRPPQGSLPLLTRRVSA